MLVAERKAGVLDRVQLVEDEQVLKMIEAILEIHLGSVDGESGGETNEEMDIPYFNPLKYHTEEDIAGFEQKDDFIGYDIDGTPLYGRDEAEKADRAIEGIRNGTIKAVTHEELKAKMDAKFEAWRRRTE